LKKRNKKLLPLARGREAKRLASVLPATEKVFLLLFLQKKKNLSSS